MSTCFADSTYNEPQLFQHRICLHMTPNKFTTRVHNKNQAVTTTRLWIAFLCSCWCFWIVFSLMLLATTVPQRTDSERSTLSRNAREPNKQWISIYPAPWLAVYFVSIRRNRNLWEALFKLALNIKTILGFGSMKEGTIWSRIFLSTRAGDEWNQKKNVAYPSWKTANSSSVSSQKWALRVSLGTMETEARSHSLFWECCKTFVPH